ncbi:hypothetical protein [Archangium lansingense]|uniref:Uncharacterized protein n=1 Tax=Archangium lansingense TaxID=2995310 RepID=A0ABT4AG66_9BACT|nr:hypothetical protein [Archangium lansinium]MCY1080635.1 hypothetical protein [Archangium lansinium]
MAHEDLSAVVPEEAHVVVEPDEVEPLSPVLHPPEHLDVPRRRALMGWLGSVMSDTRP